MPDAVADYLKAVEKEVARGKDSCVGVGVRVCDRCEPPSTPYTYSYTQISKMESEPPPILWTTHTLI